MLVNRTHVEHAFYALLMQYLLAALAGDWWLGAAFGAAFFCGREHAQAEERYIVRHGGHRYQTRLPAEFGALLPSSWNNDAVADLVCPALVVVIVAFMMG